MTCLRATLALLCVCWIRAAEVPPKAAELDSQLRHLTLDAQETFRVRDLHLRRGDVSLYLNEGVLSFAGPVHGRRVAAVFTAGGVEAGDAEILVMPPKPAERASLAFFTKSANLDEHFYSAVFFFSDNTFEEILKQSGDMQVRKAPELAGELGPVADPILSASSALMSTTAVEALLDGHAPKDGFFHATVAGREHGVFNVLYRPTAFEPITVGKSIGEPGARSHFDTWVSYRPLHDAPYVEPLPAIKDYGIDADIQQDLGIRIKAQFTFKALPESGRVIALNLSRRMTVDAATIDGQPAELLQNAGADMNVYNTEAEFLVVAKEALVAGQEYKVGVEYHGSVIEQQPSGSYFVTERNLWYPHTDPMLTNFDLTFRCPRQFQVVSTGELESETVKENVRVVHRRTPTPQQLAGFNLGDYQSKDSAAGTYKITTYAEKNAPPDLNGIPQEAATILEWFTQRWSRLPTRSIAITPVPANFGQGFPGLIYLAKLRYVPSAERPPQYRNGREEMFFSRLLLPHELAHEWWGNLITSADYRTDWLMEAMANYSALQFAESTAGSSGIEPILDQFREDLQRPENGRPIEEHGPVDFGLRLLSGSNLAAWQIIEYEKGAWVLHMLRKRMGDESFRQLQVALLTQFSGKPITNEQFREVASGFLPEGQPDKNLKTFFDTWVYGTGVPRLRMVKSEVEVSGVNDDFMADLPVRCKGAGGSEQTRWMRIVSGTNTLSGGANGVCKLPNASDYLYFPN